MPAFMHAILIEGGSPEARMAKAVELLKGHFADDPAAAGKIDMGIFEDLIILEPEDSKEILVEQVEGLISLFKQKPFSSTGKACIIPSGERMNEHAQNKMLKLLEEPAPGDVIIIMAANALRLLPTIRSRCMRIWLGYAKPEAGRLTEDLRALTAALIYGKGSLAEANTILSRYEGSAEDAAGFLGSFQRFLRALSVGRAAPELAADAGEDGRWIRESAEKVGKKHADRMRAGVILAENALTEIERGYRIKYALRGMALAMRSSN